ncbi:MFS transporter [Phycicoccus sp. Soil802]|uniref:MFS transporter n=1 Tax=Phycicoccus sp. Soil802 TaxID=1736414 RepID=UPI000A6E27BC|nr:MFS transporter [Phycicoccus sp. Soil802]
MSVLGQAVRESSTAVRTVFGNRNLRRIMLAFGGSLIGDWAYATAISVWAYSVGGAKVLAVWAVVRFILMAVCTPFASTFVDRYSRKGIMIGVDLARCVLLLVIAAIMATVDPLVVFVLAGLASVLGTPFRPAQRAMMPSLVSRPEELTAVNGTSSTLESLAFFVGPALAAGLLASTSVEVVLVFDAATFLWSAALVYGVHPLAAAAEPAAVPQAAEAGAGAATEAESASEAAAEDSKRFAFLRETGEGFTYIWRNRDLRVLIALTCAQTLVAGASAVFVVSMAFDLVDLGPPGVGFLDSMLGVGALVGGFVALSRASRQQLGLDFCVGVVLWSLPLVLVLVWPTVAVAVLVMLLLGLANPLVDVNLDTLLQRLTPDHLLGRVFGTLDSAYIGSMAVGAGVMPVLIALVGLQWGMALLGLLVTAMVIPAVPRMRRLDLTLRAPEGLPLVESVPMFAPLDRTALEGLARQLTRVEVAAGAVVFDEGDEGDQFFIIESGAVQIWHDGVLLRTEYAGDYFGEIALLRQVPRTAQVRAVEPTVLRGLGRRAFLDAVLGNVEAVTAAETVMARRILAG